jgi:tetratricopeptide (TPR) repeat protein
MDRRAYIVFEKISFASQIGGLDNATRASLPILASIEVPKIGVRYSVEDFWLRGWILAPGTDLEELTLTEGERQIGAFVPGIPRDDVIHAATRVLPDAAIDVSCGFEVALSLTVDPAPFSWVIMGRLKSGESHTIATMAGRCQIGSEAGKKPPESSNGSISELFSTGEIARLRLRGESDRARSKLQDLATEEALSTPSRAVKLADEFRLLGHHDAAERIYRRVLNPSPLELQAVLGQVMVFRQRGLRNEAASLLLAHLERNPHLAGVRTEAAYDLLAVGRIDEALGQAERVLASYPDHLGARTLRDAIQREHPPAVAKEPVEPPASEAPASTGGVFQLPPRETIRAVIAKHLDRDSYSTNENVPADTDPFDHYIDVGAKEGLDPTEDFDTSFYLENNPDIAQVGLNPFYHYIVTGKAEGRLPKDLQSIELSTLHDARTPEERAIAFVPAMPPIVSSRGELQSKLSAMLLADAKRVCISLSHDNYLVVTGGVQKCIAEEQVSFNGRGDDYVQLFPALPLPRQFSHENDPSRFLLTLTANGQLVGTAPAEVIIKMLAERLRRKQSVAVIHSLLGHSPGVIRLLVDKLDIDRSYFWIHDYFSVCQGYTLMRNDLAFCHAPPPGSAACDVCVYGSGRIEHLEQMRHIFRALRPTVVAPSDAALDLWKSSAGSYAHSGTAVVPHCTLKPDGVRAGGLSANAPSSGPIRIAHLGFDLYFKGWNVFERLARTFSTDDRYLFMHLGHRKSVVSHISFQSVRSGTGNLNAMIDAIQANSIDAVVVWPNCFETFSYVLFEAMAAGALVLTHPESGNVAAAVRSYGAGFVLANEAALHGMLSGGELQRVCVERRAQGIRTSTLIDSGGFAALLDRS